MGSSDGMFKYQTTKIIEKAKNIISWIPQTFTSRSSSAMITLYKSLLIPIQEYCSVLWSPNTVGVFQRIKEIKKSFKNHLIRKLNGTIGIILRT